MDSVSRGSDKSGDTLLPQIGELKVVGSFFWGSIEAAVSTVFPHFGFKYSASGGG